MKSLRRHVNGRGTIRARKMTISVTKRRNTWKRSKSKHEGKIVGNFLKCKDKPACHPLEYTIGSVCDAFPNRNGEMGRDLQDCSIMS